MKKIRPAVIVILALVLAFSLTACGNGNSGNSPSSSGGQNGAAAQSSAGNTGTAAMDNGTGAGTGASGTTGGETREGIIGGAVNDLEKGAENVGEGLRDMTGETTGGTENRTGGADTTSSAAAH